MPGENSGEGKSKPRYNYSTSSSFTYGQGNPLYKEPTVVKPSPSNKAPKKVISSSIPVNPVEPDVIGDGSSGSVDPGSGGIITNGNIVFSTAPTNFVYPTPPTPTLQIMIAPPPPPVKTATIDSILFDNEATPIDTMADLIFENIGGQELINITRSDIVNGQKISYQPIKNLSSIQQRYNPNNILSLQQTANKYFAGFSIKLEDKIPNEGNGTNGENVYIEESTGDLIIEFININNDEQIEIQITTDGTIYEADLGEIIS